TIGAWGVVDGCCGKVMIGIAILFPPASVHIPWPSFLYPFRVMISSDFFRSNALVGYFSRSGLAASMYGRRPAKSGNGSWAGWLKPWNANLMIWSRLIA